MARGTFRRMPRSGLPAPTLRDGVVLRELGTISSVLPAGDVGAQYDRHAAFYDRLVGNRLYNRLIWGTEPADYAAFAAEAAASGGGLLLDAGCGTGVFTAPIYRAATRPVVLLDRSTAMLERAADRLSGSPALIIQADIYDLPFEAAQFETVACHAMLHVLDDPAAALVQLAGQLAPGGRCFASMLVTDRGGVSGPYQRLLRSRGELGVLWSAADFEAAARAAFGSAVRVSRTGSMAWLRAR